MFEHPDHVVAFHVVRHLVPLGVPAPGPIWSTGALSVQRVGEDEASFVESHFVYEPGTDPAAPVADLRALTKSTSHVVGCIPNPARLAEHYCELRAAPPGSLLPRALGLRADRYHVLDAPSDTLDEIANDHGILCALPEASPLEQARRAPNRAQAIWLTFLWFATDDAAVRRALAASFRAWRALQDAQPIRF